MDPQTTRKLIKRSSADLEASNNCWQTPPLVFAKLNQDFGPFTIDLTADPTNHLLPDWIGPGHPEGGDYTDVLRMLPHMQHHRGYSNPVYHWKFLEAYIPLLADACLHRNVGATLLLPLRTTGEWWRFLMEHQHTSRGASGIYFCDKRICFYEDGHPRWNAKELAKGHYRPDSAVFDSVIVDFANDEGRRRRYAASDGATRFALWEVPPHVPKSEVITL